MKTEIMPGDTVYEVFTTTVRRATVERVYEYSPAGNTKSGILCTIICDDGTLSPRYYVEDFGTFLFLDKKSAAKKAEENRQVVLNLTAEGKGELHSCRTFQI